MRRVTHLLDDKQVAALKKLAAKNPRINASEHIRRAVDEYLRTYGHRADLPPHATPQSLPDT
jgi:Ribbon-helix-helix protein, copG family